MIQITLGIILPRPRYQVLLSTFPIHVHQAPGYKKISYGPEVALMGISHRMETLVGLTERLILWIVRYGVIHELAIVNTMLLTSLT